MVLETIKYEGSKANPINSTQICKLLGVTKSHIRLEVNKYRQEGIPICSNHQGYYYAESTRDVVQTIKHLKSRIKGIQEAISGLEALCEGGEVCISSEQEQK